MVRCRYGGFGANLRVRAKELWLRAMDFAFNGVELHVGRYYYSNTNHTVLDCLCLLHA